MKTKSQKLDNDDLLIVLYEEWLDLQKKMLAIKRKINAHPGFTPLQKNLTNENDKENPKTPDCK